LIALSLIEIGQNMHVIETSSPGDLVGLLEILEDHGSPVDIARLDDSLDEERSTLMNLLKDAEALSLVEIHKGDVSLTTTGKNFMKSDIEGRRRILKSQLSRVDPFLSVIGMVRSKKENEITKEDLDQLIEIRFPSEDNEKTFRSIINWGRYSKILEYDSSTELITLLP
jgi:NitT/TauT family transport system ATP-binding protein